MVDLVEELPNGANELIVAKNCLEPILVQFLAELEAHREAHD